MFLTVRHLSAYNICFLSLVFLTGVWWGNSQSQIFAVEIDSGLFLSFFKPNADLYHQNEAILLELDVGKVDRDLHHHPFRESLSGSLYCIGPRVSEPA